MKLLSLFASSLLAIGWANAVHAQSTAQAAGPGPEGDAAIPPPPDTIVVTGERIRGQLIVDEPPIAEYDSEDIAAFGASSIADIVAAIEPATGGARGGRGGGRPVFLINGIRVSSWREFRSYPPESVAKVEVFSEEIAQRFGYDPDQRVVNIVLKNDYAALTLEGELEAPARGGYWRNEQEATYLKIADGARLNFNLDIEDTSLLTEAERGFTVPSAIPGVADEAPFRSLVADSWQVEGTANYARAFIDTGASLSLNATLSRGESTSLSGLRDTGTGAEPIERRNRADRLSLGGAYNRNIGSWQTTFTSDAVLSNGDTEIDARTGSGFDRAETRTRTIVNKATFTGYPLELPAGEISTTIDLGLDWKRLESADTRSASEASITRRRLDGGVNVNIPIARRGGAWGAIGTASVNFAAGAEDLSDFGSLANWTAGINWSPFAKLNLQATRIWREVAPGISALGNPRIDEFNVPVFDFATGQSVLATVTTGGNPNLAQETQSDWKFGANWELPFWDNTRLQTDYAINRSRDVTLSSPSYTAAFEQAFPDRVERNAAGELLAIDRRPVTLFQTRSRTLSFGLSTRGRIGGSRSEGRGGRARTLGGRGPGGAAIGDGARVDAERRALVRQALCGEPPQLDRLPPPMLERLRGEDGEIDRERLKRVRDRICAARSDAPNGEPAAQQDAGTAPARNPFARRRSGGGRYFASFNHTITLENEITLAQGGPVFDQIDGFVLGSGAIPKHSSRLEAGLFMGGYGIRLSGRYLGEAVLRGSGVPGSSDLFFGDLATFDIRLFADLGQVFEREDGVLKGLRVAFRIDNVFDGQRRVVDAGGAVPDAYDPRRLDPVGRYLGVDVRKVF